MGCSLASLRRVELNDLPLRHPPRRDLGVGRTLDVAGFRRLVAVLRRTRPDVVHAHLEMAMTMAIPAARRAGIPVVGTFHHVHRPLSGRASARERLNIYKPMEYPLLRPPALEMELEDIR